jgi:hypothetical protein
VIGWCSGPVEDSIPSIHTIVKRESVCEIVYRIEEIIRIEEKKIETNWEISEGKKDRNYQKLPETYQIRIEIGFPHVLISRM